MFVYFVEIMDPIFISLYYEFRILALLLILSSVCI